MDQIRFANFYFAKNSQQNMKIAFPTAIGSTETAFRSTVWWTETIFRSTMDQSDISVHHTVDRNGISVGPYGRPKWHFGRSIRWTEM